MQRKPLQPADSVHSGRELFYLCDGTQLCFVSCAYFPDRRRDEHEGGKIETVFVSLGVIESYPLPPTPNEILIARII